MPTATKESLELEGQTVTLTGDVTTKMLKGKFGG